jgi:hypothetical protein
MTDAEIPELKAQNSKFGYKAPESVYKKHQPGMTASGEFRLCYFRLGARL